jgi:hypothetical protein
LVTHLTNLLIIYRKKLQPLALVEILISPWSTFQVVLLIFVSGQNFLLQKFPKIFLWKPFFNHDKCEGLSSFFPNKMSHECAHEKSVKNNHDYCTSGGRNLESITKANCIQCRSCGLPFTNFVRLSAFLVLILGQ